MPGFIPNVADGLLKVDTPKGSQKPQHPFVTPVDTATKANPPTGHPEPATGTVTGVAVDTSAESIHGRMPHSKSNLSPMDPKRRQTTTAQQGVNGKSDSGTGAVAGGARGVEKVRGQSEEVEEGELEPGERAAGYESGREEQRGAPAPAGPSGECQAAALCCPLTSHSLHTSYVNATFTLAW